jgi:hypothetical protein
MKHTKTNQTPERRKPVGLYRCIYDPKETQLGYSLKYVPFAVLSVHLRSLVVSNECGLYTQVEVDSMCNEDKTTLFAEETIWQIVWRNNAIPTETEWLKMSRIWIEFRVTCLHGCVAILHKLT